MPLVPFLNGEAEVFTSYWVGSEVKIREDGTVSVSGPHGVAIHSAGTELLEHNIPPQWPPTIEPPEWETVTDETRDEWKAKADLAVASSTDITSQVEAEMAKHTGTKPKKDKKVK